MDLCPIRIFTNFTYLTYAMSGHIDWSMPHTFLINTTYEKLINSHIKRSWLTKSDCQTEVLCWRSRSGYWSPAAAVASAGFKWDISLSSSGYLFEFFLALWVSLLFSHRAQCTFFSTIAFRIPPLICYHILSTFLKKTLSPSGYIFYHFIVFRIYVYLLSLSM